jgi:hypothetical protein
MFRNNQQPILLQIAQLRQLEDAARTEAREALTRLMEIYRKRRNLETLLDSKQN